MTHEETIFEQALGIGSDQARGEFLRNACAGDQAMLERLEALLRAHERAGQFLEHDKRVGEQVDASLPTGSAATATQAAPLTEKPGDRIGRYKLLQKIGEGGCGLVYMAEQEEPVRRRVALKIIKLGMDTRQVIARFEAERQALALMDHPNIAKVYDAGATDTGRPYFVMELVRGVKITDFCDQKKLTTRQRLETFMQVCRAVQHAHQKGIIHRDLKPSNILVSLNDGVAVPKVIDFGIAKATTGEPLTDKTVFTAFEQFIGTPAYMSPEQALVTNLDIDTRTDIYSLGVLLYELLTGQTPFDARELVQAGLEAMRRTICEREPQRPSTRLSTLPDDELSTTAQRRGLDAPKLVSQLRGDLDWIVMKCLEKDRARRYETANGLAADIQRHLNNEPVVACPPSLLYEFRKTVRRHKFGFAAAGAVMGALLIGLGFSTAMLIRERQASQRAEAAEKKAEREAANSQREAARAGRAESDAQEKLWNSYLDQAKARRWSGRVGRRVDALEALKKAAAIRPQLELRNEAIACMTLSDLIVFKEWDALPNDSAFGAFDANFERYARGETNGTVSVRRVGDDQELARFPAFGPPFSSMSFSPNGRFLMQFGGLVPKSYGLRVSALETSQAVLMVTNEVPRVATFSPDSRLLAVATFTKPNYPIRIYDTDSGELKKSFDLGSLAWAMQFHSTQSNLLATSDDGPAVRVWDWTSGTIVQSFEHPGAVKAICWHPEGQWLATACSDYGVHLWETATGQDIAVLRGHSGVVTYVGFNRDGSLLVSSGWDGALRLWDTAARKELLTRQMPGLVFGFGAAEDRVGYKADFTRLGILQVIAPAGYRALRPREPDDVRMQSCSFSGDGRILVSVHEEHIRFWDTATGRQIARLPGADAVFDAGDKHLFTRYQNGVQEWEVRTTAAEHEAALFPTRQFPLRTGGILLNHDGTMLGGVVDGGDSFKLLDLFSGQFKGPFKMTNVFFAALSPDGKLVATWPREGNGEIEVTDVASATTVKRLPFGKSAGAVFSPNGRWLAIGEDSEIHLWDRATWKPLYTVPRHFTAYWCKLAFSPDSSILAVAYSRDVVRLLESASGKELATLAAPEPPDINWISFSPDGAQLAVASGPGTIHLWDLGVLRRQLDEMKLDWGLPPLPPPPDREHARPITLTFLGVTNNPIPDRAVFAARAAQCSPKQIDLSATYNATLTNCWFNPAWTDNDLADLPQGVQTLQGIEFDIRGLVQLHGNSGNLAFQYPSVVTDIAVNQPCRALNFLHAVGWEMSSGAEVGQYVVHYRDGVTRSVPLFFGENIDWWCRSPQKGEAVSRDTSVAWRGQNPWNSRAGYDTVLYKFRWVNPRPDVEIQSLDLKSAMTLAAPFLIAITAE